MTLSAFIQSKEALRYWMEEGDYNDKLYALRLITHYWIDTDFGESYKLSSFLMLLEKRPPKKMKVYFDGCLIGYMASQHIPFETRHYCPPMTELTMPVMLEKNSNDRVMSMLSALFRKDDMEIFMSPSRLILIDSPTIKEPKMKTAYVLQFHLSIWYLTPIKIVSGPSMKEWKFLFFTFIKQTYKR